MVGVCNKSVDTRSDIEIWLVTYVYLSGAYDFVFKPLFLKWMVLKTTWNGALWIGFKYLQMSSKSGSSWYVSRYVSTSFCCNGWKPMVCSEFSGSDVGMDFPTEMWDLVDVSCDGDTRNVVNIQKTMERSTIFYGKIHYFYGDVQ